MKNRKDKAGGTRDGLRIRGDSLYCPLAFSVDPYWNCLIDCHHCYFRRLNRTWGTDLRPVAKDVFERRLINGLKNRSPKSPLAHAISKKKTIRVGDKVDPFQPAESRYKSTKGILEVLNDLDWSTVIQTRCSELMIELYYELIAGMKDVTFMPVISPGWTKDWEVFEKRQTTHPDTRIAHIKVLRQDGVKIGVNGEPFIPGYHTIENFEDAVKRLSDIGVKSYNTYSFHWNDLVAKRLHAIGVDIERIWYYNCDEHWKPILAKLISIAKKYNIDLGCPDFVNSGDYVQRANTCCGMDVSNPTTFNVIQFKKRLLAGQSIDRILSETWDGVGDYEEGVKVLKGGSSKFYTMKDVKTKKGLLF